MHIRKLGNERVKERVLELLSRVQLGGYEGRYPSQLLGGGSAQVH